MVGEIATKLAYKHVLLKLCEMGAAVTLFYLQIQNAFVRKKLSM